MRAPRMADLTTRRSAVWIALAIALAVGLQLPSLGAGFYADDWVHQLVLDGGTAIPTLKPWALFDFGVASEWPVLDDSPWARNWWTSPDFTARFFRPLTSLTLWLDHSLYGADPIGYHVTSLAWYLGALLLIAVLYRSLGLDRATTAVALVLVAGTNGATLPAGWPSNRNTLIAGALVVAAVLVAIRGRGRWRLPVAFGVAILAVTGKESGVLGLALIAVWHLLAARRASDADDRRRALWTAIAAAAAAMLVVLALAAAGFGTRSMYYATPWHQPWRYLGHLAVLATAGGLRLVAPVSVDLVLLAPATRPFAIAAGLVAVVAVARWLWPRVASHPAAPFLAAWLVLGLLPQGGVMPSDRLLFDAAIGSAGLLALGVMRTLRSPTGRRSARAVAWTLVVSAGVLGCGLNLVQSSAVAHGARALEAAIVATDPGPPGADLTDAVVLQSGNQMLAFCLVATWAATTHRHDVRFTLAHGGATALEWHRDDKRTCTLRATDGAMLESPFEQVLRSGPDPPRVGQRYRTAAMEVEPVAVDQGGLRSIRLHFRRSLDNPELRFLIPDGHGILRPVPPPPVGATVVLPRATRAVPMLP